jgi:hypothetical protein
MRSAGNVILMQDMRNEYCVLIAKLQIWNGNIKSYLPETQREA